MKIIIFGCGKIGSAIISSLVNEGHEIVAIDRDPAVIEEITTQYDVMGLCGNGVDCNIMNEAGVGLAELFIAVTGSDELNMLSCFLAKSLGAKNTIARIRTPEYNDSDLVYLKQKLNMSVTLNPESLVAHEIYDILHFPSAIKVETFSSRSFKIIDFIVKEDSPFANTTLWEARKQTQTKFLICHVVRGDEVFIPDGNFRVLPGDKIGFTAPKRDLSKLISTSSGRKRLKNVIILGASKISYYLSKLLIEEGINVKIIEIDKERCLEMSNVLPDVTFINGDGMNQEILLEEGLKDADAFIALTGNDEQNILSSFAASGQSVPTVIAKVNKPELAITAEKLGLDRIVSTKSSISSIIARYARAIENSLGSNVETLYKLMDGKAEVLEFNVLPDFKGTNIPLRDMKLQKNILITGIIRNRQPIIPSGEDVILPYDKVVVVASGRQLDDLNDILE